MRVDDKIWWLAKVILVNTFLLFTGANVFGQSDQLSLAQQYAANKDYDKAIEIFKTLYDQNPIDAETYNAYLHTLLNAEKYKQAEKLVDEQSNIHQRSPLVSIDMGQVYTAEGKEKKANEKYDEAIQYINGDDMLTQQMANEFQTIGKDDYAIKTYERATQLLGNPYVYSSPLAKLYSKEGDIGKAIEAMIGASPYEGMDNVKATLLEILGNDPKKLQLASKTLLKKTNEQPDNPYYPELLTWIYTQKNDWEGALIQLEAIDERNKENGDRLIDFAHEAVKQNQYDIAIRSYNDVIEKGKDHPLYAVATSEKLNTSLEQLKNKPDIKPDEVAALAKGYEDFLNDFPQYYSTETANEYALLEAQYANDPVKGIDILNKAMQQPNSSEEFIAKAKLQLGDYYILTGQVWDASLTYSQVEKQFKQDALGEEARFRNARLAYYRGDFAWAQDQLSVLKASTSKLMANDALYLSVLITENIGPDSNLVPLKRFAYADLLLFQNKDKDAETLLDSISAAFPQHPLNDDILMLRSKIAEKHHDYNKALAYLKNIYEQYGKDVLGDDAVFRMAQIYEQYLHQNDQAKHYYEQLIIDYPGSTFVQIARQKLQELNNNTSQPTLP
ncbi:MAG TPA: tetratricopeptide repeat protein [Flavipsychrobacter sp.]|nr:tetratricopeptide repeat protein [Flavipsychrobacter sp.]